MRYWQRRTGVFFSRATETRELRHARWCVSSNSASARTNSDFPMITLEGIWQPLYAELGGEEAPKMALEKMEIEFRDDQYAVRFAGLTADHGTYTLDADGH